MSPEHESSYYEIALTNRQVLTIFIVLLTCLVAAFLSGVWIGRGDGAAGPLQAAAVEETAEADTASMTELNFFSDGQKSESAGKAAPPPETRPSVTEPTEKAPPASAEAAPPPAAEPAPKSPSQEPARQPEPSPATLSGRVIQVFSTIDAAQADKLVRRLGEGGYPAFLVEESLQGRTTYRVRVGPYQQEERARKIADQLRREYRLETWITTQSG